MEELINSAFLKTRSWVYYDRSNLHTRASFSDSKNQGALDKKIRSGVKKVIEGRVTGERQLARYLSRVNVILQPKKFENLETPNSEKFHTNINWSNSYKVETYNYFIDCPPELHVIATLWTMVVGTLLEEHSSSESYGWNLHHKAPDLSSNQLFKYYVRQYGKWRDSAINIALETVKKKKSVTIVGLDIKQFYYHVEIKWHEIYHVIKLANWDSRIGDESLAISLTQIVEQLCVSYLGALSKTRNKTHPEMKEEASPLPLGITFSPILANWILRDFDALVHDRIKPVYYGRYVDDLLFVLENVPPLIGKNGEASFEFLKEYFVKGGVLAVANTDSDEIEYNLCGFNNLRIQALKIQIHHFDPNGSLGALEKFRDDIREIVSEFRLLPHTIPIDQLEQLSYELLYDGSRNTLKSVKGFEVNRWQLSKVLSAAAATRLFAVEDKKLKEESKSLRCLLHGILGLKFYDMWEKVFVVMLLGGEHRELHRMYWVLKKSISKLQAKSVDGKEFDDELSEMLYLFYSQHLDLTLAMTVALVGLNDRNIAKIWTTQRDKNVLLRIGNTVNAFRESNLIRHHYVGSPLINFTNYRGDWTESKAYWKDIRLVESRFIKTPRFIHLDEFSQAEFLMRVGGRVVAFADEKYKSQFQNEGEI